MQQGNSSGPMHGQSPAARLTLTDEAGLLALRPGESGGATARPRERAMKLAPRAFWLASLFLAAAPFSLISGLSAPAHASGAGALPDIDIDISGAMDAVAATASGDAARASPFARGEINLGLEHIREDGLRLGLSLGLVAGADSGRRGLSQGVGECPPALAECNALGGLAPVGLYSGLFAAADPDPAGARLALETAHVYVRAPYWEARLGYGPGAAALESEALPGALRLMRADGPLADPSGRNLASTLNTLSAHAPKLVVRSRRLAGFRLSGSYTPDGDVCGVSVCRVSPDPGVFASASPSRIVEAGVSFDYRFPVSGIRWRAYITGAQGEADGPFADEFDDPWVYSAGVQAARGSFAFGAAALVSNDGFAGARYRAEAASISYERGDWLFSAEVSQGQSTLVHARSQSILAAASRYFDPGIILGFGVSHTDGHVATPGMAGRARANRSGTQAFVELGLRF